MREDKPLALAIEAFIVADIAYQETATDENQIERYILGLTASALIVHLERIGGWCSYDGYDVRLRTYPDGSKSIHMQRIDNTAPMPAAFSVN